MKKSIIASVVALGMVSGLAQAAAVNEVQFKGNVTAVTCDLTPSVDGSMNPNGPGVIQLGDVKLSGVGKIVNFAFKPTNTQENQTACDNIANGTQYTNVSLQWSGSKFGSSGLAAADDSAATGSHVEIKPVNSTAGASASFVKADGEKNTFPVTLLKSGNDGLKYEAVLKAGATAGEFHTSATFNMDYK